MQADKRERLHLRSTQFAPVSRSMESSGGAKNGACVRTMRTARHQLPFRTLCKGQFGKANERADSAATPQLTKLNQDR